MVNGRVSLRNVRAMDGRRTRFAGEMGGGRFFPTTRKKSIETRKKTINFKCVPVYNYKNVLDYGTLRDTRKSLSPGPQDLRLAETFFKQ
jgi:hypothetical protein